MKISQFRNLNPTNLVFSIVGFATITAAISLLFPFLGYLMLVFGQMSFYQLFLNRVVAFYKVYSGGAPTGHEITFTSYERFVAKIVSDVDKFVLTGLSSGVLFLLALSLGVPYVPYMLAFVGFCTLGMVFLGVYFIDICINDLTDLE